MINDKRWVLAKLSHHVCYGKIQPPRPHCHGMQIMKVNNNGLWGISRAWSPHVFISICSNLRTESYHQMKVISILLFIRWSSFEITFHILRIFEVGFWKWNRQHLERFETAEEHTHKNTWFKRKACPLTNELFLMSFTVLVYFVLLYATIFSYVYCLQKSASK